MRVLGNKEYNDFASYIVIRPVYLGPARTGLTKRLVDIKARKNKYTNKQQTSKQTTNAQNNCNNFFYVFDKLPLLSIYKGNVRF